MILASTARHPSAETMRGLMSSSATSGFCEAKNDSLSMISTRASMSMPGSPRVPLRSGQIRIDSIIAPGGRPVDGNDLATHVAKNLRVNTALAAGHDVSENLVPLEPQEDLLAGELLLDLEGIDRNARVLRPDACHDLFVRLLQFC